MQTSATPRGMDQVGRNASIVACGTPSPLLFGKRESPGVSLHKGASTSDINILAATKTITAVQKENVDAD